MSNPHKTVLVAVTVTPRGTIVQGSVGVPDVVPDGDDAELGAAVRRVATDPEAPAHDLQAAGVNWAQMFQDGLAVLAGRGGDG